MAIFHYEENPVKRSEGKSVVNTAAYCEKIEIRDHTINKKFDYSHQQDEILFHDTLIPDNCPYKNAEQMWNAVEKFEESKKAVLGQRVDIAIPKELTKEQAIELAKKMMEARRAEGRGVSYGIHDKDGNLHIDAVYTPRAWDSEKGQWGQKSKSIVMLDKNGNPILNKKRGKGQPKYKRKNVNLDDKEHLAARRKQWEVFANEALAAAGRSERIDCRSLKAQREEAYKNYIEGKGSFEKVIELSREPTRHEYRISENRRANREIRRLNAEKQAAMREVWKLQKQLNWYRKRERNQRRERYNNNAKQQRRINAGRDLQAAFQNASNNASARPAVFTSLSDLKGISSIRTVADLYGLPLVSGRGMDEAGQRLAMLLQRVEPRAMEGWAEKRRLHTDVRGASAEPRRNATHDWGGITFVAFRDLSQGEKIAAMDYMGARKWDKCKYMGAEIGRKRQNDFMRNSFFMRSENGNLYQLHNRESYYNNLGIKSGLKLTPDKARTYIKGMEKATWSKEGQKLAPLAKMASKDNPRAAAKSKTAPAPSKGGKGEPQNKSEQREQRIEMAKGNVKEAVKTPLKVCEDILTNPLTGILKMPFRAAEMVGNAVEAGYNLMEAAENGVAPARAGDNREDALSNALKDWSQMSQARREDEQHKQLARLI